MSRCTKERSGKKRTEASNDGGKEETGSLDDDVDEGVAEGAAVVGKQESVERRRSGGRKGKKHFGKTHSQVNGLRRPLRTRRMDVFSWVAPRCSWLMRRTAISRSSSVSQRVVSGFEGRVKKKTIPKKAVIMPSIAKIFCHVFRAPISADHAWRVSVRFATRREEK
jgi:hypothetical protein